jgi:hypothetical protein
VWDRYLDWGIANPEQRKALTQLQVSDILTKDSREAGNAPFVEIQNMSHDAIEVRVFRDDLPLKLVSKSLGALAEATMDLKVLYPSRANKYRTGGFQMLWSGITKQSVLGSKKWLCRSR